MPRAVVDAAYTEKHDLRSCPGGFVLLRRMTYGEFLDRRAMVSKMSISGDTRNKKDFSGELALVNRKVTELEFAKCIVDHNLEDEMGNKLNLSQAFSMDKLDPRIGEEISDLIDKMNQFEAVIEEGAEGNS